jgi:tetratricopeptide (TPR) repeat protein
MTDIRVPDDPTARRRLLEAELGLSLAPEDLLAAVQDPAAQTAVQQGLTAFRLQNREGNLAAQEYFMQAIRFDPTSVRAYAVLAAVHRQHGNNAWTANRDQSEQLADALAQQAVELARAAPPPHPFLPTALVQWGWVCLYIHRDHAAALAAALETMVREPPFAEGFALAGHTLSYLGQAEVALAHFARARALAPGPPGLDAYYHGHAWTTAGTMQALQGADALPAYRQAVPFLHTALEHMPAHRPARAYLAAVLRAQGQAAEAHTHMTQLHDEGRPSPVADLARFAAYLERSLPYRDPQIRAHLTHLWEAAAR